MSARRLIDLCLLAYPRAIRRRDRDHLRDLALELAEDQGLARQGWSFVLGGMRQRVAWASGRTRRAAAAAGALLALALAANVVVASAASNREVERFACSTGCAAVQRQVAEREQAGWTCTADERAPGDGDAWECTRSSGR
jgi:hypothetical protein